jgi:hypothetical protein
MHRFITSRIDKRALAYQTLAAIPTFVSREALIRSWRVLNHTAGAMFGPALFMVAVGRAAVLPLKGKS